MERLIIFLGCLVFGFSLGLFLYCTFFLLTRNPRRNGYQPIEEVEKEKRKIPQGCAAHINIGRKQ